MAQRATTAAERITVAGWHLTNLRTQTPLLLAWLAQRRPDVVALLGLGGTAAQFPAEALARAGYHGVVAGPYRRQGVALLHRGPPPLPLVRALPGDAADREARYLEAAARGVLWAVLRAPAPGTAAAAWWVRLAQRAQALAATGQPAVLLGDAGAALPADATERLGPGWHQVAASVRSRGGEQGRGRARPGPAALGPSGLLLLAGPRLQVQRQGVDAVEGLAPQAPAPWWAELVLQPASDAADHRAEAVGSSGRRTAHTPPAAGPGSPAAPDDPLARYNAKRDFDKTAEPPGQRAHPARSRAQALAFVVQKHWASHLHYDLRLEWGGVMLSWAVPKGPSYDPAVKALAVEVEPHPLAYNRFEGRIPRGEYGAGTVIVWDHGTWEPVGDAQAGLAQGKLVFRLHGHKLAGLWELVRMARRGSERAPQWLWFKKRGDAWVRPAAAFDVRSAWPDSVIAHPPGLLEARQPHGWAAPPAAPTAPAPPPAAAGLPERIAPQLATLVAAVPPGDWIIEAKYDGYRILARTEGATVRLVTRNGHDWTARLAPLAQALAALGLAGAWLDGEIVVPDEGGRPDFNRLQNAMDRAQAQAIVFYVFDMPCLGGEDLRPLPLRARRAALEQLLAGRDSGPLRLSQTFDVPPADLLGAACRLGLEGVIAKRADAPYTAGRSESWLKLKCQPRQEFVVVGFTQRSGGAREVGSLLLGYHDAAGRLLAAGSVGTGWSAATGRALYEQLVALERATPADPQAVPRPGRWTRRRASAQRWVEPALVVEVAFAEWTPDGQVRQAVLRGVRHDKSPREIVREQPRAVAAAAPAPPPAAPRAGPAAHTVRGLAVSHAERVVDAASGLRKIDLVRYYDQVAERILPHLAGRPVSLVRAPEGLAGALFFQKHAGQPLPGVTELDPALSPGHAPLLGIDTADAVVAAAQRNVLEFHTWNARLPALRPDRLVLDLDPGEGVTWPQLQEAAGLVRVLLSELGLQSWPKTSGGKGLHVVVPLAIGPTDAAVKAFAQAVVRHMARVLPTHFVAVSGAGRRVGRIFIDYLRNGAGQTTVAAWSARARPGLGVSVPVAWEQLHSLRGSSHWTVALVHEALAEPGDPWAAYWTTAQPLPGRERLRG